MSVFCCKSAANTSVVTLSLWFWRERWELLDPQPCASLQSQSVCTLSGQYNRVYVLFPDNITECMYSFRTIQQSVCTLSGQYNRVYVLFPNNTTECMYSFRTIQQSVCTLSGQYNRVYVLFPDNTTECMYSFQTIQQSVCTLSGQYNRVYVLFPDNWHKVVSQKRHDNKCISIHSNVLNDTCVSVVFNRQ